MIIDWLIDWLIDYIYIHTILYLFPRNLKFQSSTKQIFCRISSIYRLYLSCPDNSRGTFCINRHLCNFTASFTSRIYQHKWTEQRIRSSILAKTQEPKNGVVTCTVLWGNLSLIMRAMQTTTHISGQHQVHAKYQYCS